MAVLSLAVIPGGLAQLLLRLDPLQALALDIFDWLVVFVFISEYAVGLASSRSRLAYARAPTSLLSLSIIILALLGAVLSSPLLYSAPALRLLRVLKLTDETGHSVGLGSKHP